MVKKIVYLIVVILALTLVFYFSSQKVEVREVLFQKIQNDPNIEAKIIDIRKKDNNLMVVFIHDSPNPQPILIDGEINYKLDKNVSAANESVTLTVFDWNQQYFRLFVGLSPDVFEFGRSD